MQIKQFSCDISPVFRKGLQLNLADTSIVFEWFHVVKIVIEAFEKGRKDVA